MNVISFTLAEFLNPWLYTPKQWKTPKNTQKCPQVKYAVFRCGCGCDNHVVIWGTNLRYGSLQFSSFVSPPQSRCAHDTKLCIQGICICAAGNVAAICSCILVAVHCAYMQLKELKIVHWYEGGEVVATVQTVQQWWTEVVQLKKVHSHWRGEGGGRGI